MARGWESKSVEEQIQAREDAAQAAGKARLTVQQREIQARRDGLLLSRKRIAAMIEASRSEPFRQQQQRALDHLDAELAALGDTCGGK